MTPAELRIGTDRELGLRGSLRDFIPMVWPLIEPATPFQSNWHIDVVADHLEAVTRRELRTLVINVPPGCMKSLLVGVVWPVWHWIRDPGHRWLHASYDEGLCLRDARKRLTIIQSGVFQARWGERLIIPKSVPAVGEFQTLQGGLSYCTAIPMGKVTGWHFDTHVYDDPHKPAGITRVSIEAARRWRGETAISRYRDAKTSATVLVMQRLHERDFTNLLEEEGAEVLRLPMRYEPKACSYTRVGGDLRSGDRELLWPERIPEKEVALLEKTMGSRTAAAQLQQRPVPEGGSIIHASWRRTWVPRGAAVPEGGKMLPNVFDILCWSWDCAFKGLDDSDYVAGQLWGRKGPDFFCLHRVHKKMDFVETLAAIERSALMDTWGKATRILVEDKANGPAVISMLQKKVSGIEPVDPQGGKIVRGNAVAPLFESGNVFHPAEPWADEVWAEYTMFPSAAHDDDFDATTQALTYLHSNALGFERAMAAAQTSLGQGVNPFR